MATDPDGDVVTYLAANVVALTANANLFASKEQAEGDGIPHEAVFVLASGGPAPEAYLDGNSGTERQYSGLQIMTRSEPRDYNAGKALARSVRNTLHHSAISGYIDVRTNETEPLYLGEDGDGHHRWTTNLELWHEQ